MPIQRPLDAQQGQDPALVAFWVKFGTYLDLITQGLASLPDFHVFQILGLSGKTYGLVTVADFRFKFANISWTLVGSAFDNGGVGKVQSSFADPVKKTGWQKADQETNFQFFKSYALQPKDSGLIYLALHETAHVTEPGIATWDSCWQQFKDGGGTAETYPNTALWNYNEQFANCIVVSVVDSLRLARPTFTPNPFPGYLP